MSSGEYLLICRSVQRLSVESAVEIFCFEHIDDHMLIYLLDQLDDIVDLIGGDHSVSRDIFLWL